MLTLTVTLIKPSKYGLDGYVERFRMGYMPNVTLWHMRSMTPTRVGSMPVTVRAVDEMLELDLSYLDFRPSTGNRHLVALVGTQSHQFQRAFDLASKAVAQGAQAIIGGPHPMTCDTSGLQGIGGVSYSLAEAELVWSTILHDASRGELKPVYGRDQRWQEILESPVVDPPPASHIKRHFVTMFGVYPARGCPYRCNFCSVIQIAGNAVRGQSVEVTLESLRRAKAAGVKVIVFTSDNFNKYAQAPELLEAMIQEKVGLPFFIQADPQIAEQEWLVEKLALAGCRFLMVGAESFNRAALVKAKKLHNNPDKYAAIVRLCRKYGIAPYFSNIIGFPDDTITSVKDGLRQLKALDPAIAWFYIMTPGPGTEQYADFMARGLITERNLDRYDATYPTWAHPHLSHRESLDLLYYCYREFYGHGDTARRLFQMRASGMPLGLALQVAGYGVLSRYKAWHRVHPMVGGIMQVRRDSVDDYINRRRRLLLQDLIPLPVNLPPTFRDLEMADRNKGQLLHILPS